MLVTITNKLGLHARPAAKIAETANRFTSNITLTTKSKTINAKSIMHIMMLAAGFGTQISICAEGEDEVSAVATLGELINSQFDEIQ